MASKIDPTSSIPELIKFLRHSFHENNYAEVENILVNRENTRKVEIETLVKEVDSLKELVDAYDNIQSRTLSEKCSLEKQLEMVKRRGDELDKLVIEKGDKIETLEAEKSDLDKKLQCLSRNCEQMHANIFKMLKRAEESDKLIVEMKEKIVRLEGDKSDLEKKDRIRSKELNEKLEKEKSALGRKLVVSSRNNEELHVEKLVKMAEIRKLKSKNADLEKKLVVRKNKCDEVDKRLVKVRKEIEEIRRENDCANDHPAGVREPSETEEEDERRVVIGSHRRVRQSGGEAAREKTAVPSSSIPAGKDVIEIRDSDSDSDDEERGEDSVNNSGRKRRRSNSTQPSGFTSSSSSCSC